MTKVIKIHYPTADTDDIGTITAAIRDQILKDFESARISYSFSSQKSSGYLMVYPTEPILSIRVSNHTTNAESPKDQLIEEDGRVTVLNAEVENGQRMTEAILAEALAEAEKKAGEIRELLRITKME